MDKLISVSFVFSNNIWVVCSQLLSVEQGSATFLALRTGLKLKFFRGPAFKKPRMFSNEYLLQLVYIITTLIQ